MKRILVLVSLLVMASLVLTACGGAPKAANHLEAIKQAGVIKVGTSVTSVSALVAGVKPAG